MDFELTKSQKEIQKAAREFAKGEFDKELALELDRTHEFPKSQLFLNRSRGVYNSLRER